MAVRRKASPQLENVRMGPLAFFTLVATICMAVLAVLSVSTANATLALAQRRADATTQLYLDEAAAQSFVAALDEQLAGGANADDALSAAVDAAYKDTGAQALDGTDQLEINCSHREDEAGTSFDASFDCGNGRHLEITLHLEEDGTLSVQKWRMTTVQNDEPALGNLFGSSGM